MHILGRSHCAAQGIEDRMAKQLFALIQVYHEPLCLADILAQTLVQ